MISKKPVSALNHPKACCSTYYQHIGDALTKVIEVNKEHEPHQLLNFDMSSLQIMYYAVMQELLICRNTPHKYAVLTNQSLGACLMHLTPLR